MCGLCQPQCPTYRVARTEAESPRGRIALSKAIALGTLDAAARASAITHLDQCLTCMNCQRVCPSQVHYGELIVATRQVLAPPRRVTWGDRLLRALTARPGWLGAALRLGNMPGLRRVSRSAWLERALRPLGLDRLVREMPRLPPAARAVPRRTQAKSVRGRVGLFLGCAAAALDRDVHAAAIQLLNALGYEAVLPRGPEKVAAGSLGPAFGGSAERATTDTRWGPVREQRSSMQASIRCWYPHRAASGTLHDRVSRTPASPCAKFMVSRGRRAHRGFGVPTACAPRCAAYAVHAGKRSARRRCRARCWAGFHNCRSAHCPMSRVAAARLATVFSQACGDRRRNLPRTNAGACSRVGARHAGDQQCRHAETFLDNGLRRGAAASR